MRPAAWTFILFASAAALASCRLDRAPNERPRIRNQPALGSFEAVEKQFTSGAYQEILKGAEVTAPFLESTGMQPDRGRLFATAEFRSGARRVVMLHSRIAHAKLGGLDPVGKPIQLDGADYIVVGVAPPGFNHPEWAHYWVPKTR